jgi:TonB family protein
VSQEFRRQPLYSKDCLTGQRGLRRPWQIRRVDHWQASRPFEVGFVLVRQVMLVFADDTNVSFVSYMICRLLFLILLAVGWLSPLNAQPGSAPGSVPRPKAIYTPAPVYRPEWARQRLSGKGVVLVTIDKVTGKVTGAKMLQSTGSPLLDGSALQAYSQWRFEPGTVSQLKIPIEFANRPPPRAPKSPSVRPVMIYPLLILLGIALGVMFALKRRNVPR